MLEPGRGGCRYRAFVDLFRPVARALLPPPRSTRQCFVVRTLLMHEFRRVQLRAIRSCRASSSLWIGRATRRATLCRKSMLCAGASKRSHLSMLLYGRRSVAGGKAELQSQFAGVAAASDKTAA